MLPDHRPGAAAVGVPRHRHAGRADRRRSWKESRSPARPSVDDRWDGVRLTPAKWVHAVPGRGGIAGAGRRLPGVVAVAAAGVLRATGTTSRRPPASRMADSVLLPDRGFPHAHRPGRPGVQGGVRRRQPAGDGERGLRQVRPAVPLPERAGEPAGVRAEEAHRRWHRVTRVTQPKPLRNSEFCSDRRSIRVLVRVPTLAAVPRSASHARHHPRRRRHPGHACRRDRGGRRAGRARPPRRRGRRPDHVRPARQHRPDASPCCCPERPPARSPGPVAGPHPQQARRPHVPRASVTAGPFAEPDGLQGDSPLLVGRRPPTAAATCRRTTAGSRSRSSGEELDDGTLAPPRLPAGARTARCSCWPTPSRRRCSSAAGTCGSAWRPGTRAWKSGVPSAEKAVFPRHTAVLGTTGGGKSNTVAGLVKRATDAGHGGRAARRGGRVHPPARAGRRRADARRSRDRGLHAGRGAGRADGRVPPRRPRHGQPGPPQPPGVQPPVRPALAVRGDRDPRPVRRRSRSGS